MAITGLSIATLAVFLSQGFTVPLANNEVTFMVRSDLLRLGLVRFEQAEMTTADTRGRYGDCCDLQSDYAPPWNLL